MYSDFLFLMQLDPMMDTDTAVVIGHGNVALDIARILLTPLDILKVSQLKVMVVVVVVVMLL